MRPESSSVIFRADLAAIAMEHNARIDGKFIGQYAAPVFDTPACDGTYPIMRRANFQKPASTKRAEGAGYNRIIGQFGQGNYACEENGLELPVDDRRKRRYASMFDAEASVTRMGVYQVALAREARVAALYAGAGFTNHNVTTAWTTTASATPLDDIASGVDALSDNCGADPGEVSLIIPRADFREMCRTDQVNEKLMYTYPGVQPAQLTPLQVAAMLGIKRVLVPAVAYDSTEEGYAASMSQIWPSGVMYICVLANPGEDLEVPSVARTVRWTADAPETPVVESYREDKTRSDIVRVREDTDEILLGDSVDLFCYQLTNT